MNDETTTLDQTDEEILTPTVSDEAMEAAAGIEGGSPAYWFFFLLGSRKESAEAAGIHAWLSASWLAADPLMSAVGVSERRITLHDQ